MKQTSATIITGRKSSGPIDFGRTVHVTRFANELSRRTYDPAREPTAGKVVLVPGKIKDVNTDPNTIFGTYRGVLSYDMPIASVASVMNKDLGLALPQLRFYDHWGQALGELREDIAKYGSREAYKRAARVGVANIVNSTVVDSTKNLNILDRVLGLQSRSYFLQMVVTPIAAPNLVFTVDEYTEGSVQAKVPELEEPLLVAHSETRTTKVLYKNIGHLAESEEAQLMALHNTMALRQDKTLRDMARLLNSQIATELETATGVGGSDWGATSGTPPDSSNNPLNDLQTVITTIRGNGFPLDGSNGYIAVHDRPALDLTGNKFIRGRGNVGTQGIDLIADRFTVQGLPPGTIDQALTNTVAIVGTKEAVWLGQGPTIVASYNEDVVGYKGWLIKQYVLPYLAQGGGIRKLTGISA